MLIFTDDAIHSYIPEDGELVLDCRYGSPRLRVGYQSVPGGCLMGSTYDSGHTDIENTLLGLIHIPPMDYTPTNITKVTHSPTDIPLQWPRAISRAFKDIIPKLGMLVVDMRSNRPVLRLGDGVVKEGLIVE